MGLGPEGAGDSDGPLKVLVVDDDHDIHVVLGEVLEESEVQCEVSHAYHGSQALEMMKASPPHLLLLDIRMPVMNGLALRQEMFHDPEPVGVQVAVFTGNILDKTELQVLMADYFIPKPASLEQLAKVIEQAKK